MRGSVLKAFSECIGRSRLIAQHWHAWAGPTAAVALVWAAALIFDAMTPQIISVGTFYAGIVLIGFWFSNPKAALVLALLATASVLAGNWITIADNTAAWESWTNRVLDIGTVWMTAVFVWRIRVLGRKLREQIEIANSLSREMDHRVGNHLQFVAAFLRLQAKASSSEQSRHAFELAGSRVMAIGNIQRMLSHSPSQAINSKEFLTRIIDEVRSTLPEPEKIDIAVRADPVQLTSTTAVALGALSLEVINNSVKHAFPDGMKGTLSVRFTALNDGYIAEFKDDGVGVRGNSHDGFGTQNVADLARLMGGLITCQPADQTSTRPGTIWRLVVRHTCPV